MTTSLDLAVEKAGGVRLLAAKLKVSHQAVYAWVKRGWVPLKRAAEIERKTGIPKSKLINPQMAKLLNI